MLFGNITIYLQKSSPFHHNLKEKLLAPAAPVVDPREALLALRGINLLRDGVTVTNGKELFNLPRPLKIPEDVTLPFPLPLLTAEPEGAGTLHVWRCRNERLFRIEIGSFQWQGKALPGNFANQQVIPADKTFDYQIEFHDPGRVIEFPKTGPDCPPFHAIELNVVPGGVTVIPNNFPDMELRLEATVIGARPRALLTLNKHIPLRMLQQGYTKLRAHSDGRIPVIAEGGSGRYLAMPIHILPKDQPEKETSKMENIKRIEHTETATEAAPEPVNPMEELDHYEQYGLARDGQRMFGVIRINKSSSMEWSRCIGSVNPETIYPSQYDHDPCSDRSPVFRFFEYE